jgi:uncharacterized protein YdcH (DUF465 family)
MDEVTKKNIESSITKNPKLKRIYQKHRSLDDQVSALDRRTFLTEAEEFKLKKLKLEKLKTAEELNQMIRAAA